MLISNLLTAKPICILSLIVPDWKICWGEALDIDSGIMRVLSYTRQEGISRLSTLSCSFEHQREDHILTPMTVFDPNIVALSKEFTLEYMKRFYRTHTHLFTLEINTDSPQPLCSEIMRTILPFDDEPATSIKMTAYPTSAPIYEYLRHVAVHSPLNLLSLDTSAFERAGQMNRLDRDRSAFLRLSWSKMPNLESVALDLRLYSHHTNTRRRCLSKNEIIARANEMGCHLKLKTLVLAGLQSYDFFYDYERKSAHEIEQLEALNGEPNWIKIFRPAVREGGRIILVDKLF
ncbi:hypothetical protein F5Y08DRAFT_353436 [Xylaria arbuscula]|nr:hypothetical protein F5Y08DRAFT_353436 [Xylaria arbuscula]